MSLITQTTLHSGAIAQLFRNEKAASAQKAEPHPLLLAVTAHLRHALKGAQDARDATAYLDQERAALEDTPERAELGGIGFKIEKEEQKRREAVARFASGIQSARSAARGSYSAGVLDDPAPPSKSESEIIEEAIGNLEGIRENWLKDYEDVLANYIEFYDELAKALALLSSAITGNDGDKLKVDFFEVQLALYELRAKFDTAVMAGPFDTEKEAKDFLAGLGVQGLKVEKVNDHWVVKIDMTVVDDLRGAISWMPPDYIGGGIPVTGWERDQNGIWKPTKNAGWGSIFKPTLDPAKYNAIIAAKDSQVERLSQINNLLAEKFQRVNQQWDTIARMVSDAIKSLTDAVNTFARNI